jgi:site-specific recombinase XerD
VVSRGARRATAATAVCDGASHRISSRHAHAVAWAHEGALLIVMQRQLGHSDLGITSIYPQRTDNAEIIGTVHAHRVPMVPVSASLRL